MTSSTRTSTRLFVDASLQGDRLRLAETQAHYLGRVLRRREGDLIVVFNARGDERLASIESLARKRPELVLSDTLVAIPEPRTRLILLQALVKSDAMDLIVQKATELGVASVVAMKSEYSVVRLDADRRRRRLDHWNRVAISACEQCGRHRPPMLEIFDSIEQAAANLPAAASRIALHPGHATAFDRDDASGSEIALAIGPEGGFSPSDVDALAAAGFLLRTLGPRVLRTETAAIAACTSAQLFWGDLAQQRELSG
jgi:16S rRNA (uracil1498-N3)-methyltransferase